MKTIVTLSLSFEKEGKPDYSLLTRLHIESRCRCIRDCRHSCWFRWPTFGKSHCRRTGWFNIIPHWVVLYHSALGGLISFLILSLWAALWLFCRRTGWFDIIPNTPPGAKLGLCRRTIYSKLSASDHNLFQIFLRESKFFFEHQIFLSLSGY